MFTAWVLKISLVERVNPLSWVHLYFGDIRLGADLVGFDRKGQEDKTALRQRLQREQKPQIAEVQGMVRNEAVKRQEVCW